jgi:hypothetical protein
MPTHPTSSPTPEVVPFDEFAEAVAEAKRDDAGVMLVPEKLGGTLEEVMSRLRYLARAGVPLMLMTEEAYQAATSDCPNPECPGCRNRRN